MGRVAVYRQMEVNLTYPILDFGHFPRNRIAGKSQPDASFIAGAWEAESFRDVYLPTRLHLISRWRLPALAWSAEGRFLELAQNVGGDPQATGDGHGMFTPVAGSDSVTDIL